MQLGLPWLGRASPEHSDPRAPSAGTFLRNVFFRVRLSFLNTEPSVDEAGESLLWRFFNLLFNTCELMYPWAFWLLK